MLQEKNLAPLLAGYVKGFWEKCHFLACPKNFGHFILNLGMIKSLFW